MARNAPEEAGATISVERVLDMEEVRSCPEIVILTAIIHAVTIKYVETFIGTRIF